MTAANIILLGFGNVGRAFVKLVQKKKNICADQYRLHLNLVAVLNRKGGLMLPRNAVGKMRIPDGADIFNGERSPYWKAGRTLGEVLETHQAGVFVECSPSDIKTGEPALGFIRQAMDKNWHVVTANKGPLVVDLAELMQRAEKRKVSLGISGATAAALPTLDVALRSLAGTEIHRIEGILNGTTNYVLTRMDEGMDFPAALKEAQEKGIAEPDPSQDVDGWDTAAKILIIANAIFKTAYTMGQMHVEGITNIPPEFRDEAKEKRKSLKLIGRCDRRTGSLRLETKLSLIEPSHPLYGVDGAQKGITFLTDTMGSVTVTGGKSDPTGAAAALLKDIINILRS